MTIHKTQSGNCLTCHIKITNYGFKYCSNRCQMDYQYLNYIKNWKEGQTTGIQSSLGIVSHYIKRYLREKYGNQCCLCGWAEVNPHTKQIPLVADHIDGNWHNNIESNLRLICPNCDSLTSTYAGLNRGHGRKNRAISKRANESKMRYNTPV